MQIIFAVGNSGTKHLVIDNLIKAYMDAKFAVYEQLLGTRVEQVDPYYESTPEKTLAYIKDYINFYKDEYDILFLSGWEINKHINEIYREYVQTADFICIKMNEDFTGSIDPQKVKNSWEHSEAHINVKKQMTEILQEFYKDKPNWFTAELEPKIENFKISSSNGAHKISILSAVNK